ncbi:MAG: SHOCT domain-containing protein, partial [Hylemonella sp.]
FLGMLLFWGLLLAGVVAVVRMAMGGGKQQRSTVDHKSALDILNERYARGDIDREEFLRKRDDLKP